MIVAQRHRVDALFTQRGNRGGRIPGQTERFSAFQAGAQVGGQGSFKVGEGKVATAQQRGDSREAVVVAVALQGIVNSPRLASAGVPLAKIGISQQGEGGGRLGEMPFHRRRGESWLTVPGAGKKPIQQIVEMEGVIRPGGAGQP